MKIALISCSKEKVNYACPAYELYSASNLFSLSYQYAQKHADKIYILSAKYGLVEENQPLEPYNQTLKEMSRQEQLQWAEEVLQKLEEDCDVANDQFIFLTGNTYSRDLLQHISHYSLPLEGMRMGERMAHLKKLLVDAQASICVRLHQLFCCMPRYSWEQIDSIPFMNGIYIVFEKGELYHNMERVVRVGTHTSPNRLKQRLVDHFVNENHDGSIFRKNIGKAILNANKDPYLTIWTLDTSKPENRCYIDQSKNLDTERRVSKYLRENFTFTVFQVVGKEERLRMEEAIIATLNHEKDFCPSSQWLGRNSTECDICQSGMWLKQGLNGQVMTETEYCRLLELCEERSATVAESPVVKKKNASVVRKNHSAESVGYGKYEPLYHFFQRQTESYIALTILEIEKILGFQLPKSAYTYAEWWRPNGHPHCQAWLQAGFDVIDVATGIRAKRMTFERVD